MMGKLVRDIDNTDTKQLLNLIKFLRENRKKYDEDDIEIDIITEIKNDLLYFYTLSSRRSGEQ
jgi:hypothetical protein